MHRVNFQFMVTDAQNLVAYYVVGLFEQMYDSNANCSLVVTLPVYTYISLNSSVPE